MASRHVNCTGLQPKGPLVAFLKTALSSSFGPQAGGFQLVDALGHINQGHILNVRSKEDCLLTLPT